MLRSSTPLTRTLPILYFRSCISFGQLDLHLPPASPSCSEISSIDGEVFQTEVGVVDSMPNLVPTVDKNSMLIMEQEEDLVDDTRTELEQRMRMYTDY